MKKLVFIAVLSLMTVAGSLFPARLIAQQPKGPRIEIKEPSRDFGKVVDGTKLQHVFEIANTGDETLEIQRIQPT